MRLRSGVDRYLAGLTAMVVSVLVLVKGGALPVLVGSAFFLGICVTDTLWSRIPNWMTLPTAVAGVTYNAYVGGFRGAGAAVLGAAVGLTLLLVPYLLGGMGGGDIKALGALGALLGPWSVFQVFLYTALAGALLSLIHWALAGGLRTRLASLSEALGAYAVSREVGCLRPYSAEKFRFPYAAAIAFGFFAHVYWGGPL